MRVTRILLNTAERTAETISSTVAKAAQPVVTKPKPPKPWSPINNRSWRDLDPAYDRMIPPERKFTVLSYNILNQAYLWPQIYDEYVPKEYQDWSYRLELLKKTLTDKTIKSDIMCLQEVDQRTYRDVWQPMFETFGYGCEFKQKSKPEYWDDHVEQQENIDDDSLDGLAVLYNKEKFNLIEKVEFDITDHYWKMKEKSLNKLPINNVNLKYDLLEEHLKQRNQIVQILVLRHKVTGRTIILANTHLYWRIKPIQFIQSLIIIDALNQFKQKYPNMSTIIYTGDFNSTTESAVYEFLREKEFRIRKYNTFGTYYKPNHPKFKVKCPLKMDMSLNERLLRIQVFKKETHKVSELYTCHTKQSPGALDHLWFNDRQLKLTRVLTGFKQQYTDSIEGLPNADHPSDHIPIRAEFAINIKKQNNDHTYD